MKRIIISVLAVVFTLTGAFAKDKSSAKVVTASGSNISISYGQSSRNGKQIFGTSGENAVIPYGTTWTMGEGKSAQLTLKKDCLIGGNKRSLKAGTYSLFAKPAKGEWVVIFNSKPNLTSIADLNKNADKTVISTWGRTTPLSTPVDKLTMSIQDGGLQIEWDNTSVLIPIEFVN